jgi:alpha/beta superfamily hydrolase
MGGDRHHPLMIELAKGLAARGVATLRLDLRDPIVPASADSLAVTAAELRDDLAVDRLLLVGYSWGAAVVAHATAERLSARVLVAPPVTLVDFPSPSEPALVLVPAHDQYSAPDAVETALASWPAATIETVDGCDHFLMGAIGRVTERTVAWLTAA